MADEPVFVDRLRVHITAVDADTALATVAWLTPAAGRVSVRRAPHPAAWPAGARVTRAEAEAWGEPLAGDRVVHGAETQLAATVPTGRQVYLPFTFDGADTATVGEPVAVGVPAPVAELTARRTGREMTVSWVWPPSADQVEVAFLPERGTPYRRRMTRQAAATGCRVPAGSSGGTVSVRSVARGQVGDLFSTPRTVAVEGVATILEYHLPRVGRVLGRGRRLLRVGVDQACTGVELRLVLAEGDAMPDRPEDGRTLQRFTGLRLDPDTPWEVPFTVPRTARPYWLRCFVVRPAGIRVVDPINEMRAPASRRHRSRTPPEGR